MQSRIINEILETEDKAQSIIKDAEDKARTMVLDAQNERKSYIKSEIDKRKEKLRSEEEEAERLLSERLDEYEKTKESLSSSSLSALSDSQVDDAANRILDLLLMRTNV